LERSGRLAALNRGLCGNNLCAASLIVDGKKKISGDSVSLNAVVAEEQD
jgi:hypothetical protein